MPLIKFSFSQKIQIYAFLVTFLSLALAAVAFITIDSMSFKKEWVSTITLKAEIIGRYNAQGIADRNLSKAQASLDLIANDQDIIGIWIYTPEGKQLLAYDPRRLVYLELPESLRRPGEYFDRTGLKVVRDVWIDKRLVGKVMIIASLSSVTYHTYFQLTVILIVSLLALCIAVLFSFHFQRSLTRPLASLVQTVLNITKRKDYTVRAVKQSEDDLGTLTDAFNTMLREVQARDTAISQSEERLNLALWGSNDVMLDWDIPSDTWYFDDGFETLFGYPRDQIPTDKKGYFKLIEPKDVLLVEGSLQKHLSGESPLFQVEHRILHQSGRWCWVFLRAKVVERNNRGKALRIAGTIMDVTVRKRSEEKLKLFNKIFDSTTEGVMVSDANFGIIEVNPAFSAITGFTRQEIVGQSMDVLHSDKQTPEFYKRIRHALLVKGSWQGELWEKRKNGEVYPQRLTINTMYNKKDQITHYVAIFSDITMFKQTEDELAYITHYDALTSLPNRNLFKIQLEKRIELARNNSSKVAILLVGLDNFKMINDSYGHEVGDALLQIVAKKLLGCIEKQDLAARITGDEFGLIITKGITRSEISALIQKIFIILSANNVVKTLDISIGASIGISLFPEEAKDARELFLYADTALYLAKQSGRNGFKFYDKKMNALVKTRHKMEVLLKHAIANEELSVVYQPMINAQTSTIIGAEALVRWNNPELGRVSPTEFIPIAEESGMIDALGKWVLKTACLQNKRWHDLGFCNFKISVNLSAYQFQTGDLVDDIARIVWESNMEASCLDLELTEGVLMENPEKSTLMLEVLRSMGITLSIDDFGTGYSSLSYLKRFPLDTLKIDRSFIRNVCTQSEDASIVKAIVSMAKGLKLKIVAEGVETSEQASYLLDEGIDVFQGSYYSMPIPAVELTELLQSGLSHAGSGSSITHPGPNAS